MGSLLEDFNSFRIFVRVLKSLRTTSFKQTKEFEVYLVGLTSQKWVNSFYAFYAIIRHNLVHFYASYEMVKF